jgi:2-amino-4-hydroxy-6-hydroxymethyldihydropteridine diphosphokinase
VIVAEGTDRVRAYVGLGANVGDARRTLEAAVHALDDEGRHVAGVSRLYRTRPVGVTDQPDFRNAVVGIDVPAGADPADGATALLVELKDFERAFGRRRRGRWGPRELDLDLLLFGDARLAIERPPAGAPLSAAIDPGAATRLLEVPHPELANRLFVLAPLADLAPDLVPPGWSETVDEARRRQERIEGPDAVTVIGAWNADRRAWDGEPEQIEVRRAELDDVEAMARVHTASAEAAYAGVVPPDPGALDRRRGMWRDLIADPTGRSWVALERGTIVGVANAGPSRDGSAAGELRILYVLPARWGSGAGQALLERVQSDLAERHREGVLTVLAANARARRFYERNEWELDRLLVEPHFGGRPTEVARYRRALPAPERDPAGSRET